MTATLDEILTMAAEDYPEDAALQREIATALRFREALRIHREQEAETRRRFLEIQPTRPRRARRSPR